MSENQKEVREFSINFDKEIFAWEMRRTSSVWTMIDHLDKQVDAQLDQGKWYAIRYRSREEPDGSWTFAAAVVKKAWVVHT